MEKLNYRQLIVHFVACWLFIFAFQTLGTLYDFPFIYTPYHPGTLVIPQKRINFDTTIIELTAILGLVVAYVISWRISVKHNWFWTNSVVVLVVACILKNLNFLGWMQFKTPFLTIGNAIFDDNSIPCILTNALVMLGLGSALFFLKPIQRFIDKGVKPEVKATKVKASVAGNKRK